MTINNKSLKNVLEIRYIDKIVKIIENVLHLNIKDKSLVYSDGYQKQGLRLKTDVADIHIFDAPDCYIFEVSKDGEENKINYLTIETLSVNTKLLGFLKEHINK